MTAGSGSLSDGREGPKGSPSDRGRPEGDDATAGGRGARRISRSPDREEVRLFDPFLAGEGAEATHLDLPLTRGDVEEAARPFITRTLEHLDSALRDAKVRPSDLDRVLLVGGSSKMPIVRTMVAAHLGRPAQLDLDADRAVTWVPRCSRAESQGLALRRCSWTSHPTPCPRAP